MNFKYSCCFTRTKPNPNGGYTSEFEISNFEVGEKLFYTKDVWSGLVKIKLLSIDSKGMAHIMLVSTSAEEITTTREHMIPPENPDIGWIPSTVPEYRSTVNRHPVMAVYIRPCRLTDEAYEFVGF